MRLLGELGDDPQAQKFAAYLLTQGIETQIDLDSGDQAEIWVKDEDRFQQARDELMAFQANPGDAKYLQAMQKAKEIAREKEKKRKQIQKKIVHVGAQKIGRRPTMTLIVIGISVLVALATNFGEPKKDDDAVFRVLQFVYLSPPQAIALQKEVSGDQANDLRFRLASLSRGEIWRTVTPIFIHFGIFHIVFNMYWLFLFGSQIENRYGPLSLGLLILAVAVISNLGQGLVPDWMGGSPPYRLSTGAIMSMFGGMSGVVYGLFGYFWMKSVYDPASGFRIPQSTVVILVGWMLFCMLPYEMRKSIGFGTNVANWAHGVGLAAGMAIGYFASMRRMIR